MSTTVREYLGSGLEQPRFTHVWPHPLPSLNEAYELLAENITLRESDTLLAVLNEPVGPEQQRTSKRGYIDSLKHLSFLINEHSIALFYTLHVLERLNVISDLVEASILYELPFASKPLGVPGLRDTITYTPDFTICEGHLQSPQDYDSLFLSPAGQRLIIGEFKYRGIHTRLSAIPNTIGVAFAGIGQCLWYCMRTKTRFCVIMNDHEMVFIEFECKDQELADI